MTSKGDRGRPSLLLKTRLGLGALILGSVSLLTAAILYIGMQTVAERLDTALRSETRMARYATLSTQATTFLVIATESIQSGVPVQSRLDRLAPVREQMGITFGHLRSDVENAVEAVRELGLDEQSRYGTQSLGLARMEALLNNTMRGLGEPNANQPELRAHVDSFASQFDPLMSQAVNTELLFRNGILSGIETTRRTLTRVAFGFAIFAILSTVWFYFGLVRPQFSRLDRLREAAFRIGQADFAVDLPAESGDEIGQLYTETNRMARALHDRQSAVETEWAHLNETIEQRTSELRTANKTLSEIDENRRRFFADISHELRTPLTVITMESQIGQQDRNSAHTALATIENSAGKLNRRIDDLLRVARSETGELALEPDVVVLDELLDTIERDIRPEIDNASMELLIDRLPGYSVTCDPNWIRQVLISLIRNAIRHARSGGKVKVSSRISDSVLEISVIDNGPGIREDIQDRVFDRFVQGGTANSQGFGVGLGLAKWVAEAHEGRITLQSPVPEDRSIGASKGTIVALQLPDYSA